MSTQWRCAVCEAMNDGGDTCAACGATVTQRVVQPPPAEAPSPPERAQGEDFATEIPIRELPRRGRLERDRPDDGPYDIFDIIDAVPAADADYPYGYERIDTRPRVRVYGCCLPIALGMLVAALATVLLLGNLLLAAL
jgi:hypothetical protein